MRIAKRPMPPRDMANACLTVLHEADKYRMGPNALRIYDLIERTKKRHYFKSPVTGEWVRFMISGSIR